jgi:hypothetical protein
MVVPIAKRQALVLGCRTPGESLAGSRFTDRAAARIIIDGTIDAKGIRPEVKRRRVIQTVINHELSLESEWLYESLAEKAYFRSGGEIFSLTDTAELAAFLQEEYGIHGGTDWMKTIVQAFVAKGRRKGTEKIGRRFVAFDSADQVLRLSRWNGTVRCLDGNSIYEEPNGINAFFMDDDKGVDVDDFDLDIGPHGELIPYITDLAFSEETLGGITPEQQKLLLTVWLFALAFPDLVTAKPILILEGPPGSGKSLKAIVLQALVHGKEHGLILNKDGQRDFPVQLLRSPVAVFDNVDSYVDWIPDEICAYTTVGQWEKRKLYTDDDGTTIRPMSFPVIASKNPTSFRREDVADRTIIMRLKRRQGGFLPMQHIMRDLRERRGKLFGEYLYICNQLVAAIRGGIWDQCQQFVSDFRQADFAQMGFLVGSALGWDQEDVAAAFEALSTEQKLHAAENDEVAETMVSWFHQYKQYNRDQFLSVHTIYTQMESQAAGAGTKLRFSVNTLGAKLRSGLADNRFEITSRAVDGQFRYQIQLQGLAPDISSANMANVVPFIRPEGFNAPRAVGAADDGILDGDD